MQESLHDRGGTGLMDKAIILEGRTYAKELRGQLKADAAEFSSLNGLPPGLAIVLVGDDPSSIAYSRTLTKTATDLGFHAINQVYPANTISQELHQVLNRLNADPQIHGVSIQWPTPPHISFEDMIDGLDPRKDIEGYHPLSLGRLYSQLDTFVPATPLGGMRLLDYYGFKVTGKTCLLIGNGVTVGRPLLALLLGAGATVLVATKVTPREVLHKYMAEADFIFSAAGSPGLVTGPLVRPGVIVVDFGTSQIGDKLVGDADFDSLVNVARAITPTPGGTGPMTNVVLLSNVLKAARQQVR